MFWPDKNVQAFFQLKSSSFWVSPLSKSSSFCVSPLLQSSSFWVSPLPKSSSFCVFPLLGSWLCSAKKRGHTKWAGFRKRGYPKIADLGSGDTQKELDLGSRDKQNELEFQWRYDFFFLLLILFNFWKAPKSSWKYVIDTWFECWRMRPPPFNTDNQLSKYFHSTSQTGFFWYIFQP